LRPRLDEWRKSPTDEGTLLRGGPLVVADDWLGRRPDEFSEEERTFVAASVKFRETERDRENRAQARERARLAEIAAGQRRTARLQRYLFAALGCVVAGLVGWLNESYLRERLNWFAVIRPFMRAQVTPHVLTAEAERALKPGQSFRECKTEEGKDYCPEMVVVPAGSFMMGSPESEKDRREVEGPQHQVTIAQPYAVAKFELTFAEWDTCVAYGDCDPRVSDEGWGRDGQPVINVSWDDAQRYVEWLKRMTGKPYRLLSEAEYEYAARAGTQTAYPWGDEIGKGNANCNGCGSQYKRTVPVGSFAPNRFGLYDMLGNVYAWVEDCVFWSYAGAPSDGSAWTTADCSFHVGRGGSWNDSPRGLRSANRDGGETGLRHADLGFRVARTLTP